MSELILPDSYKPNRRNVQISDLKVCVLIHAETNRILCFAHYDVPTKRLAKKIGCKIVEIFHAHEYDRWAKEHKRQYEAETALQDHAYLERENATRTALRKQLVDKRAACTNPVQLKVLDSILSTLDTFEKRRQRYRAESFLIQEGYEASKTDVGEELVNKIMAPKGNAK